MKKNYYQLLSIQPDADQDIVKKAFRRMAHKWHPDKNDSLGAKEMFIQIQEAYECLKDSKKRLQYDYKNGVKQRPTQQKYQDSNFRDFVNAVAVIIGIIAVVAIFFPRSRRYSS